MAISKMMRESDRTSESYQAEEEVFDFGDPEIIPVEIAPGRFLHLKEPSASDLIEISKISEDKNTSDVESTLKTICILHAPEEGGKRLSLKEAKKLRAKQLKMLGNAINQLLGLDEETSEE